MHLTPVPEPATPEARTQDSSNRRTQYGDGGDSSRDARCASTVEEKAYEWRLKGAEDVARDDFHDRQVLFKTL